MTYSVYPTILLMGKGLRPSPEVKSRPKKWPCFGNSDETSGMSMNPKNAASLQSRREFVKRTTVGLTAALAAASGAKGVPPTDVQADRPHVIRENSPKL